MESQSSVENRFRNRVREERERLGWSQSDIAKRLTDKGIPAIHPSTVAKIESGERAVRINEAAALASLFGVSVDSLMGRKSGAENDLLFSLRAVLAASKQAEAQIESVRLAFLERVQEDLMTIEFDGRDEIKADAALALKALGEAVGALGRIAEFKLPAADAVKLRTDRMFDAAFSRVLSDLMLVGPDSPALERFLPTGMRTKKSQRGSGNAKKS